MEMASDCLNWLSGNFSLYTNWGKICFHPWYSPLIQWCLKLYACDSWSVLNRWSWLIVLIKFVMFCPCLQNYGFCLRFPLKWALKKLFMMFQYPARCGEEKSRKKMLFMQKKDFLVFKPMDICCCSCQGNVIFVK